MSDYDSNDDMPLSLETRGEPEDTEEKRLQRETERCRCVNCKEMLTDSES